MPWVPETFNALFPVLVAAEARKILWYPGYWRTSGSLICHRHIFLQIFKSAEELDLGCGVGGGKDIKDIFKVGISIA